MPASQRLSPAPSASLDALTVLEADLRAAVTALAHRIARAVITGTLADGRTERPRARPAKPAASRNGRGAAADAALGAAVVSQLLATPRQSPSALARALRKPGEAVRRSLRDLLADGLVIGSGRGRGRQYVASPTSRRRSR